MERRKVVTLILAATASATINNSFAQFGGLKNLTKGSKDEASTSEVASSAGPSSWGEAAEMFKVAKSEFTSAVGDLADISADIADALDLKSEAALLRSEATKLRDKGDTMGTAELDAVAKNSDSTNALIEEKLKSADALSAGQKAALGDAAVEYVPLIVTNIAVAKKLKETVQGVSSLGKPGFRDGVAAVSAAKDIPQLGPKMIEFSVDAITTGQSLVSLMSSKGVATPATDDLNAEFDAFMAV